MGALKALGFVLQLLFTLAFGVVLYALSPLLFLIWLGLLGAVALFVGFICAVHAVVRHALVDQNSRRGL